jgi:energy-coupling factor transporter ATPase
VDDPLIRVQDLHYSYDADTDRATPALCGVDLEIRPGELVAVIGHNGSGKSTLARHLNALLLPTTGDVWVKGMNTRDRACWREIRRTVAMVFQNPDSQIVATVVEEDVAFGPENLGVPAEELRERVEWAMDVTGISALRHRPPHRLSAGQKQRLALAGALALRPECLVLDEATAMLDPAGRQAVLEVVRHLQQMGMAALMITQSMEEAAMAQRVVALSQGKVALEGPPSSAFADEAALHALGLDLPPIARLSRLLHERIPDFPGDLLTPAEMVVAVKDRSPVRGGDR